MDKIEQHEIGASFKEMTESLVQDLLAETERGAGKYGSFNSPQEFYGVFSEEQYEFLKAMHENDLEVMAAEALQMAAVSFRFYYEAKMRLARTERGRTLEDRSA